MPLDFWWWVFAVFMGVALYRSAETLTRALFDAISRGIDAWLYHVRAKRIRCQPPE
jgi:hypothetical protein